MRIRTLLTENEPKAKFQRSYNGKAFTDRFVTSDERTRTGQHVFDELGASLGIEHRPQATLDTRTPKQTMKDWYP